jgi:predicted Zn-dependent protease
VRFDPSLPDDEVNVSQTHPLREAAVLVIGILGVGAGLFVLIALTIDLIVLWIPRSFEARLSGEWVAEAVAQEGEAPDPRTGEVQALLDRLAGHWPESPYAFHVLVSEETSPNAMALPGGVLIVTAGLLAAVESENELAFVLGHELGHFRNRDHLRGIGRGTAFGLVMALLGIGGDGAAQLAALAGDLTARSFGRDQEGDADRFGLELVQAEYGHVGSTWQFFEKLPEPEGAVEKELFHYLSTHPLSDERVEALEEFTLDRGWPRDGEPLPLDLPEPPEPPEP